jgi:hypothetical protein
MSTNHSGFSDAMQYPLFSAMFNRRSRRISKGLGTIRAGSLTYTSQEPSHPLSALEEAVLISVTGATGYIMPDRPFQSDTGESILGSPYITMGGRTAGSPDNAQGTYFLLINDSGTYFLKRLPPAPVTLPLDPDELIRRAEQCKVKLLDHRINLPRKFPFYLDSNRFISNVSGSTILFPIVDLSQQYINGLMYLLTEAKDVRPTFVDDHNFYLSAGVRKWVRQGFLNKDIKIPLTVAGTFRTQIEADLILQNLMLSLQAMGLGGWIHASPTPAYIMRHPLYADQLSSSEDFGFQFSVPRFGFLDILRWGTFLPKVRAHPISLKHENEFLIKCLCPPNYSNMSEAVDALVEIKYGRSGTYSDPTAFQAIFKTPYDQLYLKEVPKFTPETIACTKDICNYIFQTHGRFPAHVDAIHVPGVWLQAHHIDQGYYDYLFKGGYTQTQKDHDAHWH